ncbi:RNA polymerase II mediator complex subunit [Candida orthopsilosis Co 90-125]|uniref:Mediator of RNA polymerase II transcription subunit 16 n=1 Tax=Candida orthopsilosis (strain 90-125) TaxID=1136231 RepID=H8XA80_CANO9|nr:RNA polymerase II mediator complex subunit [Candida orthopsilosis Co 90-125]CCG25057.1 RNA polymerase II mediator complex subunit [Candida orthopsilosis Co 90-125]
MNDTIANVHLEDVQKTSSLISWSKNGLIVYISPCKRSKNNLLLTYLESVDGHSWRLAPPQPVEVKLENNFLPEISLVCWSTLSTDLAVSDVYGNFYILLAGVGMVDSKDASPSYELTSYNHMEMIYRDVINQDIKSPINPGASIIAFKWLNIEKPQILNKPASLVNLEHSYVYTYGVNQFASHGVSHPIPTKQACLALRRNGTLMLYYQGEHKVEYHKVSINLNDSPLMISNASIGFTNGKQVVITAYDRLSDDISTYVVTIDWGFLVESAKRQKTDPHYHTPKENQNFPGLNIAKIHEMKPLPEYKENSINPLSSIDLVSASVERESKMSILISYSSVDIYRYEVVDTAEIIPDAFTELGGKMNFHEKSPPSQTIELKDKIARTGKLQAIVSGPSDLYCLMMYEDGRIDVLDTKSWEIVNSPNEQFPPSTISTVFDVGFSLPEIKHENPLILAVSPNMTSVVYTEVYNETEFLTLRPVEKVRNTGFQPRDLFATSVALAYRHAYACYTNTFTDDLIILIQSEVERLRSLLLKQMPEKRESIQLMIKKFVESIISEAHKSINFQLDAFSKESVDKLLSNPPLQKLLSLQLILGEAQGNSVMSDIAWIVLNLRSTNFGIMFSLSSVYRQISKKKPSEDSLKDSITRAECIVSLIGNIKWLIDLMVYFNQELLQLSYFRNDSENSKLSLSNSVVLPVILSKVPRLFLMYAISSMGKTHEILKKLHKDLAESNKLFTPMKEALNRYFTICSGAPLTLSLFEQYLRECDALIAKEFATRLATKEKGYSLKIEQKLVCHGEITDDVKDIARILVDRYAHNISREMKVSELYFYNTEWLNIGFNKHTQSIEDSSTILYAQASNKKVVRRLKLDHDIDALRKIYIYDGSIRRCTRCRSVSLVTDPFVFESTTTIGLWTMVFQRTCICGNTWVNI